MNDQPNSQTANAINKVNWKIQEKPYCDEVPVLGFLQLCADRRFHRAILDQFQEDGGLAGPEDCWIHADAGGTPKMECQRTAPDYCYYDKGVRLMGWSAHGDVCGGFGPDVPDDEIEQALLVIARRKIEEYPEADHFIYFVTTKKGPDANKTIVCSMKCKKGSA
jgi:hypothetical protein